MSINKKIGQLFLTSFANTSSLEEAIHLTASYQIGGFIFDQTTTLNSKRLHRICSNLQHYASDEQPLLLALNRPRDQQAIAKDSFTPLPDYKTIGAKNRRLYTKQLAEIVGSELRTVGINLIFSPSLFINNDEVVEGFSHNPKQVAQHAVAMVQGYTRANLTAVATISKQQIKDIPKKNDRSDIYASIDHNLYPLYEVIKKGVKIIQIPSTEYVEKDGKILSKMTAFIHDTLQYDGILAMEKHVTSENLTQIRSEIVLALKNNVHLFSLSGPYNAQIKLIDSLGELARKDSSLETIIKQALNRISSMKETYKIDLDKPFKPEHLRTKRALELVGKFS